MKILVCEDDFMILKTVEQKLIKEGYSVDICSEGKIAEEKILANDYDLIITDLLMPFVSGLEIINYVRNELKDQTPVIVLSRLGNEETVVEAFNLGANDYLTKPFSPGELALRVKKFLLFK